MSRDLEDLGAVKVRVPGGATVYAVPEFAPERVAPFDQLRRVMGEWVAEVACSANLVVAAHAARLRPRRRLGARPQRPRRAARHRRRRRHDAVRRRRGARRRRARRPLARPCRDRFRERRRGIDAIGRRPRESSGGSTLWHGRFEGGPADALMAYTVSLPFDRRLWRDDIAGSRAHVRGLARVGLLTDDERDAVLAALDQVADEIGAGSFVFVPSRRGHPHRRRAAGHRARRCRPAPSCTRHAAATTRWPPTCGCGASASWSTSPAPCPTSQVVLLDRAVEAGRRLPARLHPPPARPAGAARPPPARPRLGARPRRRPPARHGRAPRRVAARGRRAGRHVAADRSGRRRQPSSASPRRSTTPSTPSATATSSPRRCSTWR